MDDVGWLSATPDSSDDELRFYGVDVSDAGEALVEATLRDDGTFYLTHVWVPADNDG